MVSLCFGLGLLGFLGFFEFPRWPCLSSYAWQDALKSAMSQSEASDATYFMFMLHQSPKVGTDQLLLSTRFSNRHTFHVRWGPVSHLCWHCWADLQPREQILRGPLHYVEFQDRLFFELWKYAFTAFEVLIH